MATHELDMDQTGSNICQRRSEVIQQPIRRQSKINQNRLNTLTSVKQPDENLSNACQTPIKHRSNIDHKSVKINQPLANNPSHVCQTPPHLTHSTAQIHTRTHPTAPRMGGGDEDGVPGVPEVPGVPGVPASPPPPGTPGTLGTPGTPL